MDRDAPGSPNLKEINRRLDRLERNSYLSINAISENAFADITSAYEDVSLSAGEYENSETRKFEDRTLSDSRKLIELLEKKQEESLQEIRELTDQTREMTDVSEGENFRIQLWQKYLMQETSSIASNDELELFAGLSDADLNDVLSDAGLSDVLSDPPGMLSHFCDGSDKDWIPKLRIEAKFHENFFKVCIHPLGSYLITAVGKEFCVFDFETFNDLQILQEITHEKSSHFINCVEVHPDMDLFITGGSDASVIVWDLPQVNSIKMLPIDSAVRACAFSADGLLAVGGENGTVMMLDVSDEDPANWELVEKLSAHEQAILSCCFSSEYFVTGSSDCTIKIWTRNTEDRTLLHILEGHTDFVNTITFHHFEPYLISGSRDTSIMVWSTETFKHVHTFSRHKAPITTCQFHPKRNILFSSSTDQKMFCFNFNDFSSFEVICTGLFCAFDPGGHEIVVTSGEDGTLRLYS